MIFIRTIKLNEEKGRIDYIHYFPDMLTEEEKKDGYMVDKFDMPQGQEAFYNYKTGKVFFEKAPIPKEIQTLEELQNRLKANEQTTLMLMTQIAKLNERKEVK